MLSLLWFSGIGGDTRIRDIGWTYVILVVLILLIIHNVRQLFTDDHRRM